MKRDHGHSGAARDWNRGAWAATLLLGAILAGAIGGSMPSRADTLSARSNGPLDPITVTAAREANAGLR